MKTSTIIILSTLIVGCLSAACTKPQAIHHEAGTSLFFSVHDIQDAILEVFDNAKLKEVKLDVSKTLHKEYYLLQEIIPEVVYDDSKQVETLGANTIVKSGGEMKIQVQFKYQYVNGAKGGEGTGIGKFPREFPVTLTKNANYVQGKGLQWTCEFTELALEMMLFEKLTGGELDQKTTTTFTELLNQSLGASFECVKSQLDAMLKTLQPRIGDINNNFVYTLFNTTVDYSWGDKRMTIDETLVGYSLSATGETMQVVGVPTGTSACYDISLFTKSQNTYYAVSNSVVENAYNYLVSNNQLMTTMDPTTWNIPNFYFTVRDLAFAMPKITSEHSLDEQIGGTCDWASGYAPTYNSTANGFDLTMKYTCKLLTLLDKNLILTFSVAAHIVLVPVFDQFGSVQVQVKTSDFSGSEFNPSPAYTPVTNPALLNYFISQAASSLVNNNVFGTGLIYLQNVKNPVWEMSSDLRTIYFYDNGSTVNEVINE